GRNAESGFKPPLPFALQNSGVVDVRFGSEADICAAISHVRFTPNSDRESRHPQPVMSALPPKAGMCGATAYVCYGPIADSCAATKKKDPSRRSRSFPRNRPFIA